MGSGQREPTQHDSGRGPLEDPAAPGGKVPTMSPKRLPLTTAVVLGLLSVPMSIFLTLIALLAGADYLPGFAVIVFPLLAGFILLVFASYPVSRLLQLAKPGLGSPDARGLALNMVLVPAVSTVVGLGALAVLQLRLTPATRPDGGLLADLAFIAIPVLASCGVAALLGAGISRWCRMGTSGKTSVRLAVLASVGWTLMLVGALVLRSMTVLMLAPILLAWLGVRQIAVLMKATPSLEHEPVRPASSTAPPADDETAASRKDRPTMGRRGGWIAVLLGVAFLSAYIGFVAGLNAQTTQEATSGPPERLEMVVFAGQEIPAGVVIAREMVVPVPYPADLVVETMQTSLEQVIGREARSSIARGMPITEGMLGPAQTPSESP